MKKINTYFSLQTPQLYRFYSGWYDGGVVGLTGGSPPLSSLQFNWERLWLCWSKNINPTSLLEPRVRHKTHKNFMDIAFWNSFLPSLVILRNKRQFFCPRLFFSHQLSFGKLFSLFSRAYLFSLLIRI